MSYDCFFKALVDSLHEGAYFVDTSRTITYWNRAATRLTGYEAAEVVGKRCMDNILEHVDGEGRKLCTSDCPLAQTLSDGRCRTAEVFLHHKAGHRMPVTLRAAPVKDRDGAIIGAVEVFKDYSPVEATRRRMAELEKLALLDALTGLANRRCLEIQLAARLDEMRRYEWSLGLLFADIDHFKAINDTYGHDVGDRVIQMVGKTLATASRSFDTVARYGGEEFVAVVTNVTLDQLGGVAERCRRLVNETYIKLPSGLVKASISAGAVLAGPDETVESLIKSADECMYESKKAGRNHVTVCAAA